DGLLNDKISAILPVGDSVWLGSHIFGLTKLSLTDLGIENFTYESSEKKVAYSAITSELVLDDNIIWYGGYGFHGRFNIADEEWMEPPQRIAEDFQHNIEALHVERDKVWMGVRKEGFRVLDRASGEWKRYQSSYLDISPFLTDIKRVGDTLFFSMDTGLKRYSEKNNSFRRVDVSVFDIESMSPDGSDLWLGSRERSMTAGSNNTGLYRYNTKTCHLTSFNTLPDSRGTHVNKVVTDGPFVWVASGQGLERFCRLTGEWDSYTFGESLATDDVYTLAISGNTLLFGTDNGLFIKTIRQFDSEEDAELYRQAWHAEKAGDSAGAAEIYSTLASVLPRKEADYILYRRARCLESAGNSARALAIYEKLLVDYPLLLADIETVYSSAHGMDTYLQKLQALESGYPEGSRERALCSAYLKNIDVSLKLLASRMERSGNKEKAIKYWKLVSRVTEKPDLKKEAQKKTRSLNPN
ncbi:tetratricopeptide repeat protein, partial [bacterium]